MPRNRWHLFLLAVVLAGLTGLTACGGSGSNTGGGGGGGGGNPPLAGITIYPGANGAVVSVASGSTAQFTAYQADALVSVNWTATSGTITGNGTSSGTFTAPAAQGTITISVVSTASATVGGSVTVNVTAAAASGIVVSPGATMAQAGQVVKFTATENGTAFATTWQVNGTTGGDGVHGTIDANGNYTAPLTPPPTGSTSITALDPASNSGTASVTVVYSNNSFDGPYAFSYAGNDVNGSLTVAGSFTADGSTGSITSGEEDYDDTGVGQVNDAGATFGGSFTVGPDGRGALTINSNAPDSGGVIQFALTNGQQGGPAQHAVLIRLDTGATGSGAIDAQNALDLATGFSGNYVFGFSGVDDAFGNPFNLAGKFFSDGVSNLPALQAEQDYNYAGTSTDALNGGQDTTLTGNFVMDLDASTTGRGTLFLTTTNTNLVTALGATSPLTFQYTFYIVDSTHLKVVESDGNFTMLGDIYAQAGGAGPYTAANTLPSSNYAFTTGGTSNNGAFATGGVFVSNGGTGSTSGGITGGVYDNNDAGTTKLDLPLATTQSFSVDTLGRIVLPIEPNTTVYNYVGYAGHYNSPNGQINVVVMLDLMQNYIDSGLAYQQTAASTPSGSYILNMTGVASSTQSEQDFEGQFGTGTNGAVSGTLDINNAEVGSVSLSVPLTSSSITAVGTDGRGTPLTLHTSSPTTNYPLAYYVIDDKTALVFETDNQRVLTGIIQQQY